LAFPIKARAIGEFTDIFPLFALASGSPTIRHTFFSSVSSLINVTVAGDHWLKTKGGQISGSESRRVAPMM
jgi:hypothetical protein